MTASRAWDEGATPANEHMSIGELVTEVTSDVSRLLRQEVELAKAEIKQEASKAGKAGVLLSGAGIAGLLVCVLLSFALVYALAEVMPPGWAALIVATLWAITGAVMFLGGRRRMKEVSPVPQQTVDSLKEDMHWLRNQTR